MAIKSSSNLDGNKITENKMDPAKRKSLIINIIV